VSGKPKPQLQVERVALDTLVEHPRNARIGDVDAITESLQAHGAYKPLIVQKSTRHVLAGNHTLKAMLRLGWAEADVVVLDIDDEEALRILLIDNRSSDSSAYDDELLVELLQELPDLTGTGYTEDDLDDLLAMTTLPSVIDVGKTPSNGGKALTGLGLQWGYVQWQSKRVQITAGEVARLDAALDSFLDEHGNEAGFVHWIADALGIELPAEVQDAAGQPAGQP
jgi:hypothetical protein